MKVKVGLLVMLALVMVLGFAANAQAQSACPSISITPDTGPAGTTVAYSGSDGFGTMTVGFDGVQVDSQSIDGSFTGSFMVPAGAAPGTHTVKFLLPNEETCTLTFTIPAPAVQATAYPVAAVTTLPNTGLFILIPAAGLLAGGVGALTLRRRNK